MSSSKNCFKESPLQLMEFFRTSIDRSVLEEMSMREENDTHGSVLRGLSMREASNVGEIAPRGVSMRKTAMPIEVLQ